MDASGKESGSVAVEDECLDRPAPSAAKWLPSARAFTWYSDHCNGHPFLREQTTAGTKKNLVVLVTRPLVVKLTKDIVETYQTCSPTFTYSESFNPKRYLTNPSASVSNDGFDNENSDLILAVNGVLINTEMSHRYIVRDMLGQGTFGQVVKCWADEKNCFVAVKVIKNQPAYYHQALVEISILNMLNYKFDPEDKHHIVRILDHFVYHRHLCIVFEMLGVNLYELLKVNALKGISLNLLRLFSKQILTALVVLREASVIHCDLKPENILLTTSLQSAEIKLIDFGSACMENRTVYSYIQSRFYRSPEVVLGYPYTTAIDMWSFGCVAAELFLGLPLFPGASQYDLLQRMLEILGNQPPDHILRKAKNTHKYFKHVGAPARHDEARGQGPHSAFQFLSLAEYEAKEAEKPAIEKRYFPGNLEQMIMDYPIRKKMSQEDMEKENLLRLVFVDFLRGLLNMDPLKRWSPRQAAQHPFITEKHFNGPFKPPSEAPRLPIPQGMTVDHNPISGHWFGAGLSPQVATLNIGNQYSSPQHQGGAFSFASSYGSIGSYGSFGDAGVGFGSNHGSYGGPSGLYVDYQTPAMNTGYIVSPDRWRRMSQAPPSAFGPTHLGMSPSSSLYRPMSLGASPSQFTSPSSQFQASPGSPSTGSPSRYGPTSPARGSGVTTLGKAAVVGQYRRRGWGSPGSGINTFGGIHGPSQDNMQGTWHGVYPNSANLSGDPGSSWGTSMQGIHPAWRHRNGAVSGATSGQVQQSNSSITYAPGSLGAYLSISETAREGGDDSSSPPDPADWDPNYSEEQLLQDDGADLASPTAASGGIPGGLHLGPGPNNHVPGSSLGPGGRVNRGFVHLQGGSPNGVFSPPSGHGLPGGHGRKHFHHGPFSPQQNSPSRLGQHSQLLQQHLHYQYYAPSLQSPDQPMTIGQQQPSYRYTTHTFQSPDQVPHIPALGRGHVNVNNDPGVLGFLPSQWDGRGNLVMENSGSLGAAGYENYQHIIPGHPVGPSVYKSSYGVQVKDQMLQAQDNTSQRLPGFPPPQGPNLHALESPGRRTGTSSLVLPPTSGRKERRIGNSPPSDSALPLPTTGRKDRRTIS